MTKLYTYGSELRPLSTSFLPDGVVDFGEPLTGSLYDYGKHGTVTYGRRLDAADARGLSVRLILSPEELAGEIVQGIEDPAEDLEV